MALFLVLKDFLTRLPFMVNTLEPFQINIVIVVFSYLFLHRPLWQSRQLMGKQKETTPVSVGNSLLHLIYFNGEGNYSI